MKTPFILLALLACGPAIANDGTIRLAPEQMSAIHTQALSGLSASGERQLPAQVVMPPKQLEVISAPLAGLILSVDVAYGETVRKGQRLARLRGAESLALQRDFLQARSQAVLAAENLRRDEALFADGIISQGRLSATRAQQQQAAALIAERREALRLAGLPEPDGRAGAFSGTAEIRAPFDGVVLDAAAQPGQRVEPASPLFKVGRAGALWLEIQATPAQAAGLSAGDTVSVAGCEVRGKLTVIASHVDTQNQSLRLRAEIPRPEACLRPYQFVQAKIIPSQAAAGSWRVPVEALVRHQGKAWVFVRNAEGFRPVPATVLDESEKSTLVALPLAADAAIAVKGTAALKAAWIGIGGGAETPAGGK
ncbi:MAG: efflux RND transporter periplasmic adaptor subunit [Rhodocyclaceae bacterium]|nr:efflux RND transporter periplasmic adaptor subunit [Rhodocyclaceae bacterium]